MTNGYILVYVPEHPFCIKQPENSGWAYEHRYIIECELGRQLRKDEHVHHIDGNKTNNDRCNLHLMSASEHSTLHYHMRHTNVARGPLPYCKVCGKQVNTHRNKYCSPACAKLGARKHTRPSKEVLEAVIMSGTPATAIGEMYGVSDNAVRKWARQYGII